jgi:hypothetical protein
MNSEPVTTPPLRIINSTPDSDKTLPLPTPVQQYMDRCILNQRKLFRRWDGDSGKWILSLPMSFFDD